MIKEKVRKVVLDTNALLAIKQFNLDVLSAVDDACDFAYRLFVFEGTFDELDKIIDEQKGKDVVAAKLAKQIVMRKVNDGKIEIIDDFYPTHDVDYNLVHASRLGYLVLTQDRALKKRLEKPYLTIRQKMMVSMVGAQYFSKY